MFLNQESLADMTRSVSKTFAGNKAMITVSLNSWNSQWNAYHLFVITLNTCKDTETLALRAALNMSLLWPTTWLIAGKRTHFLRQHEMQAEDGAKGKGWGKVLPWPSTWHLTLNQCHSVFKIHDSHHVHSFERKTEFSRFTENFKWLTSYA